MPLTLAKQPLHVADQAALLALPLSQVLTGDLVIRDDNERAYILIGDDPGIFSSWKRIDQDANAELTSNKGIANGYAALNELGLVPNDQLPPIGASSLSSIITSSGIPTVNTFEPIDASAGAITRTLPFTPEDNSTLGFKLISYSNGYNVTIQASGSSKFNKIGGNTTLTLSYPNQAYQIEYEATTDLWIVVASDNPPKTKRSISAAGSTAVWNDEIAADTTTASFSLTLPAVCVTAGEIIVTNIGSNALTLTGTVSGIVNPVLFQWSSRTIRSTSTVLYFV